MCICVCIFLNLNSFWRMDYGWCNVLQPIFFCSFVLFCNVSKSFYLFETRNANECKACSQFADIYIIMLNVKHVSMFFVKHFIVVFFSLLLCLPLYTTPAHFLIDFFRCSIGILQFFLMLKLSAYNFIMIARFFVRLNI